MYDEIDEWDAEDVDWVDQDHRDQLDHERDHGAGS